MNIYEERKNFSKKEEGVFILENLFLRFYSQEFKGQQMDLDSARIVFISKAHVFSRTVFENVDSVLVFKAFELYLKRYLVPICTLLKNTEEEKDKEDKHIITVTPMIAKETCDKVPLGKYFYFDKDLDNIIPSECIVGIEVKWILKEPIGRTSSMTYYYIGDVTKKETLPEGWVLKDIKDVEVDEKLCVANISDQYKSKLQMKGTVYTEPIPYFGIVYDNTKRTILLTEDQGNSNFIVLEKITFFEDEDFDFFLKEVKEAEDHMHTTNGDERDFYDVANEDIQKVLQDHFGFDS